MPQICISKELLGGEGVKAQVYVKQLLKTNLALGGPHERIAATATDPNKRHPPTGFVPKLRCSLWFPFKQPQMGTLKKQVLRQVDQCFEQLTNGPDGALLGICTVVLRQLRMQTKCFMVAFPICFWCLFSRTPNGCPQKDTHTHMIHPIGSMRLCLSHWLPP